MGIFDTLRTMSGSVAEQMADRGERAANMAERKYGDRLNEEQRQKLEKVRYEAERAREYALRVKQEKERQ